MMHPQTITTLLLEPPYETNCVNYSRLGYESQMDCIHTCMLNNTVSSLNRVPFSVVINQDFNLTFFSSVDMQDPKRELLFNAILRNCEKRICSRPACEYVLTITRTKQEVTGKFQLTHIVPISPWIKISHRPFLSLVEVITYVMGVIGTYTGLSVIALDPVHVTNIWKKKGTRIMFFFAFSRREVPLVQKENIQVKSLIPVRHTRH